MQLASGTNWTYEASLGMELVYKQMPGTYCTSAFLRYSLHLQYVHFQLFALNPVREMPSPSLGDLPDPGMELMSSALAGGFFTAEPPEKPSFNPS